MPLRVPGPVALLCLALIVPLPAWSVSDEIQIYTDAINRPGEYGLELHVNATPKGRTTPDYPGDLPPEGGLRFTPEFSYGLSRDFDAGLSIPTAWDRQGNYYVAGAKLRLKWMPLRAEEGVAGWYAGANVELSNVSRKFSESRLSTELRLIGGYRAAEWLLGANLLLDWALSPPTRDATPDAVLALKAARDVVPGIALGAEFYNALGKLDHHLPYDMQDRSLYLVLDYDRKPFSFNFGIGRGMTSITDRWTVKVMIEVPFN